MIVIGVPTTGSIPIEVVGSIDAVLLSHPRGEIVPYYMKGSLVYDARCRIFNYALKNNADLLFLDSDIEFPPEALDILLRHNTDIVSGLYYGRVPGSQPIAYKTIIPKTLFHKDKIETIDIESIHDHYFSVAGTGLGFCLIRNNVLRAFKKNQNPFEPFGNLGEDFSFFVRCRKLGFKCMLDTTFELKHIGDYKYSRKDYKKE